MQRPILLLLLLCSVAAAALAGEKESPTIKFPSPDKRFALRITSDAGDEAKAELIEKASGKALLDFGMPHHRHLLVWSADSKWFAYCNRADKTGDLSVYVWNGTAFENIELPEDLPSASADVPDSAGAVKNYGGATEPLRWLKPGELLLASDETMLGREDNRTYVGVLRFTLSFDAQHHVTIKNVGKTKTTVSK
jgi:hypothetical protein